MQIPEVLFLRPTPATSAGQLSPTDEPSATPIPGPTRLSVRDVLANLRPAQANAGDVRLIDTHPHRAPLSPTTEPREQTIRSKPESFGSAPVMTTNTTHSVDMPASAPRSATTAAAAQTPWPTLIQRLATENASAWSALLARIPATSVVGCLGLHPGCGTTTVSAALALCRSEAASRREKNSLGGRRRHDAHSGRTNPANRHQPPAWHSLDPHSLDSQGLDSQGLDSQGQEPMAAVRPPQGSRWRVDPGHDVAAPQFLIDANIDRPALASLLDIDADGSWPEWTTSVIAAREQTAVAAATANLPGTPHLKIWPLTCALVPTADAEPLNSPQQSTRDSIRYYLPPQAAGPILQCLTRLIEDLQRHGSGIVLDLGQLPLWQRLMWLPVLGKIIQHLILVVPQQPNHRDVSRAYWQLQDHGLTSCILVENNRPTHSRNNR